MIPTKFLFKSLFLVLLTLNFTLISCNNDDEDDPTFTVYEGSNAIENGHVFDYNTFDNTANLHLKIKNNSDEAITMRVKVVSMNNANGNNFQLCVGLSCYNSVTVGGLFPDNDFTIAAGATQDNLTFWNTNNIAVGGVFPMEYVIEIYETGGSNEKIQFTYSYNPN